MNPDPKYKSIDPEDLGEQSYLEEIFYNSLTEVEKDKRSMEDLYYEDQVMEKANNDYVKNMDEIEAVRDAYRGSLGQEVDKSMEEYPPEGPEL